VKTLAKEGFDHEPLAKLFPFGNRIILATVGVTLLHRETLEARPLAE
jgi:hypothetical protein